MVHRRLKLLAMAVAALLTPNDAVAASKGAPRAGGHHRSSAVARSTRSRPTTDADLESRENDSVGEAAVKTARRSSRSQRYSRVHSKSATGGRKRLSSSVSPSHQRYPEVSEGERCERRSHRGGHGMEMVPSRRSPPKTSMFAGIAATVKGKAAAIQEDAKGKVTEWRNIAKTTVWFSSKMEKFMIQMTWPDDGLLDDVWVKDTMIFLESARNEPPRSPNNPNKRILRKLWLRMTEHDYRTKLKALQILHHATMDLSPQAFSRVRNQFLKMRDETNHKNRNEVYFEPARILDVSSSGIPFLPLLRSYSSFSFRRMTEVQGGPQQLASTLRSKKTSQDEATGLLRRLDKLICTGTRCKVDRKTLNTITGQVVNLVARDVMSLWRLYVKGLKRLMKGGYKEGKMADPAAVSQLLKQFTKTQEMLKSYFAYHKKVVFDRSVFEDNQVDPAALKLCLASFTSEDEPTEGESGQVEEDKDDENEDNDQDGSEDDYE